VENGSFLLCLLDRRFLRGWRKFSKRSFLQLFTQEARGFSGGGAAFFCQFGKKDEAVFFPLAQEPSLRNKE